MKNGKGLEETERFGDLNLECEIPEILLHAIAGSLCPKP